MAAQRREQDLTLREAAAAVGLSVGTIRAHIRAGRLTPPQVTGKWGPEYRIPPAMLADLRDALARGDADRFRRAAVIGLPSPLFTPSFFAAICSRRGS